METDARARWDILHDRQEATELGRHGYGEVVAKSGDLIANAFESVAEPTTVDDKATSDGGALGLVADKLYIHNFLGLFKTIIVNLDVNYCQFKESDIILCSGNDSLCR